MTNIAEFIKARTADDGVAILFEDESYTWPEYVDACATRATFLRAELRPHLAPHVGLLLDNTPEYVMWLGAAALIDAVIVGINPTRRGVELARDITHADCQLIVTEGRHAHLLDGLELPTVGRVLDVDTKPYLELLAPHAGAALPDDVEIDEDGIYLLLFTSGTSGAPKACICSQGRLARIANVFTEREPITRDDVMYQVMPLFHSNACMVGFGPWVASGATAAFRRRFSASGFLPDVRKFGATFFNYVGKPLSYVLATPEQPDDADNPLWHVFGNEAADLDIDRFAKRFGCRVQDGYGSTEGGANISRVEGMPRGSLGLGPEGTAILDPETGEECPRARFDDQGRLLNPLDAIGEIVNRNGAAGFEGYYKNDEANTARVRGGYYWTGDLGYRDEAGYFYFAGRDFEWLRVDGENFAAAPIERLIARHPDVVLTCVYAVPDEEVGDQVMATIELKPGTTFDPEDFDEFLAEQPDLGTKWSPRYVRVVEKMPTTESQKPMKRQLRHERWDPDGGVYWRPAKNEPLRPMGAADRDELRKRFEARDRLTALDVG
jgi:fatty-acyl-CoA synthase